MREFLRKKRVAFLFFFLLSYLIGTGALFGIRTMQEAKYQEEREKAQKPLEQATQNMQQSQESAQTKSQQSSTGEIKLAGKLMYQENGITIKQLNLSEGRQGGFNLNLEIKNDTDKRYFIYANDMRINGISVDGSGIFNKSVEPKSTAIIKFETTNSGVKDLGYEKVLSVKSDLMFSEEYYSNADETNSFLARDVIDVSLPGADQLGPPTKIPEGEVVFEEKGITVKLLKKDGQLYDETNWFSLYIENTREDEIGLVITTLGPDEKSINTGELEKVLVNNIVYIRPKSAFYGKIATFTSLDLKEKHDAGDYIKVGMGAISVESKDLISESMKIVEIK